MAYTYRFINARGEVIYYGKTVNIDRRITDHFTKGHLPQECYRSVCKIEYQRHKTESDALIMEQFYISKYSPKYNKQGQSRDIPTIALEEGKWKLYKQIREVKPLQVQNTGLIWKVVAFIYFIFMLGKLLGLI
ncbi:GIY-YIG nuclease family protein [Romboutsia sp.]|uniref:GIY-YIG nuclease family protein n=1 Tax=Romboutsia sp. TaxID=1965302 RepID=UPI002BC221B8|nr:GIY-YIG nuclease family protein [Romboutsia sp.]HSQ90328.1 GIY-YIG nuclease family protein [Romboutsia sp.]